MLDHLFLKTTLFVSLTSTLFGLSLEDIPASYTHLSVEKGKLVAIIDKNTTVSLKDETPKYTLDMVRGEAMGTEDGLKFTFVDSKGEPRFIGGTLFYALVDLKETYPRAKWKRYAKIDNNGQALTDIKHQLAGKYDFINWQERGKGLLHYRLIEPNGHIVYEGRVFFIKEASGFKVDTGSIIEGPFLSQQSSTGMTISFETLTPQKASVHVKGRGVFNSDTSRLHEITLNALAPDTRYEYTIKTQGLHSETYRFKTAPKEGSRKPFTFAFASDSRNGINSGERNVEGVNAYMIRKIAALMAFKDVAFMQFTGDMIDGGNNSTELQELQYANWKRALLPFASYIPINTSMGNHEALNYIFENGYKIDRFPFESQSAEAIFAKVFSNPTNGPLSEDGSQYDPNLKQLDFPTYQENVYHYTYDNIAMISLNSNYWYSSSLKKHQGMIGGNAHGYIMDNQMAWLKKTLEQYEENDNIDFTFVTFHTPVWPNGGHVKDDMWYGGHNKKRPLIADKNSLLQGVDKGIIERRDELWTLLMQSPKVLAVLTGDEHNYVRLEVKPGMPIYNHNYTPKKKMDITRTIYQIHNGAAGAPYYAKEDAPWNLDVVKGSSKEGKYLKNFTAQNALVLFHVDGKKIELEVINPDSLNHIERVQKIGIGVFPSD